MRRWNPTWTWVLVLIGMFAFPAQGQTADPSPNGGEDTSPPGEEVMRPTRRGLRLTPGLARAMAGAWAQERVWQGIDLTEEQERKVIEAAARRMLEIGHRNNGSGAAALEYLIEAMIATNGRFNAQISRELPDRIQPLVKSMRDFNDHIVEDVRPVLNEQQMEQFKARIEIEKRKVDRFERRLQNWREGRYQEGENPFDEFSVEEQIPGEPKLDPRLRDARRQAQWQMRQIGSWEWDRFLAGAAILFKFDAAQTAAGEALLAEYRKKADVIQTPEWKARVQKNRMLSHLQWQLGDVAVGPWRYRLDKEYAELTRPLKELTDQFYSGVLAIATPQQRAEAIDEVRRVATQHGLVVEEMDIGMLQAVVQPAAQPASGG